MTNRQIANAFDHLANLLELHDDNEFKIRSYRSAYITLRKLEAPLADLSDVEIKSLKGIGPAISGKIRELLDTGQMKAVQDAESHTPEGVIEMLQINGFGPKKVRQVWQEMHIETIGELLYACNENRLVAYKGFGLKTQEDLRQRLEYYLRTRGQMLFPAAEAVAQAVCQHIVKVLPEATVTSVGEIRRCCPIVTQIEVLVAFSGDLKVIFDDSLVLTEQTDDRYQATTADGNRVLIHHCTPDAMGSKLFRTTGSAAFLEAWVAAHPGVDFRGLEREAAVFQRSDTPEVAPELRESAAIVAAAKAGRLPNLVTASDLRSVLHVHTTWSDGLHTLRQMAERARALGYAAIGITDHSQTAFYANGLQPDRVRAQWAEIDALNAEWGGDFRILKGIESDILHDGSLDYDAELLAGFDFVIASVHAHLKMTRERATERLLGAIANPHTTILGHPTGRLLLAREGYQVDWEAIFAACKQHNVAIELNANPHRLDLDWTLIGQAREHGILISINPDAHSLEGLEHVRYGLQTARKAGLTAEGVFNLV
jgi:DNA polymerase (family X)